tara:strand:- start:796 stop:1095 length:300 start_codon:yes stop_codon:yes gene_type:complete
MQYEYDEDNEKIIKHIESKSNIKEFIESLGVKTYKKEYKDALYKCLNYQHDIERLTADNKKLNKKLNQIHNSKAYKILRWFERLFSYRVVVINLEDEEI